MSDLRLDATQLERYSRHVIMDEIGPDGQQRLLEGSVLVVGAGGLGSPAIQYLAAAGVGRLGIVDDDAVERSNLQRQIIHADADVGARKSTVQPTTSPHSTQTSTLRHTKHASPHRTSTISSPTTISSSTQAITSPPGTCSTTTASSPKPLSPMALSIALKAGHHLLERSYRRLEAPLLSLSLPRSPQTRHRRRLCDNRRPRRPPRYHRLHPGHRSRQIPPRHG